MIKDIAVHLTGSAEDAVRLAEAARLARALGARITGLQVDQRPEVLAITDPSGSAFLQDLSARSEQQGAAVATSLQQELGRLGVDGELHRLELYPGQVGKRLAYEARQSDLFVGTRPYGAPRGGEWIEEAVLFESGRPCLFVPPGHRAEGEHRTVFIAWKETSEAARAVAAAMPLLQRAEKVVVGTIDEGETDGWGEPGADICRYLAHHGGEAEVQPVEKWSSVGGAILDAAVVAAADLLVMGAYGHSRYREWILGGATRDVLSVAALPVLVAH